MSQSRTFLITSYHNPEDAAQTIRELRRSKLSDKQVGLLVREDDDQSRFKSVKEFASDDVKEFASDDDENNAGAAAAAGVAAGAGGGALWALGIAAGFLPAIGPVVGGGILGAILASAGTGAVAGGVIGSLVGLGISDEDASFVSQEIEAGSTIVVVKDPEDHEEAIRILDTSQASFAPSLRARSTSKVMDSQPVL